MSVFMIRTKSPMLRIIRGQVNKIISGRTRAFTRPNMRAIISRVMPSPS
jgi:hypothetical protein